jgi:hypothetical protein
LRPGGTRSACASGSCRDGELRHVELTALEIDVASRHREEVRAVRDLFRKAHHNVRVAGAQHLHLFRLAEDGRLLAEVQPVQRDGLFIEIHERGQHCKRLPAIEIDVEAKVLGFDPLLLLITLTGLGGARLCANAGAQDHHTHRKAAVPVLHDNSSPGIAMSNRQTSQLSLINR